MIKKAKKILSAILTLSTVMTLGNTTVHAARFTDGYAKPYGMYIRECVAYEPNYTSIDWTHTYVGSVSADNRDGAGPLTITYKYDESGTTTASIGVYANTSLEANCVFEKIE